MKLRESPTLLCISLLSLSLNRDWGAHAHLFFETPEARTCFYGGYWGPNPDGPWRRSPCDREPRSPTATFRAGNPTCLSVHEFVAHPATYDIELMYAAVGPSDEVPDDTVILATNISDPGPDGETGYQRFFVNIPENKTCETCTLQVRQYAEDLDWYYYACVDVRIVDQDDTESTISESLPKD